MKYVSRTGPRKFLYAGLLNMDSERGASGGHLTRMRTLGPLLEQHGMVEYVGSGFNPRRPPVVEELPLPFSHLFPGLRWINRHDGSIHWPRTILGNRWLQFAADVRGLLRHFEEHAGEYWAAILDWCPVFSHALALHNRRALVDPKRYRLIPTVGIGRHYCFHSRKVPCPNVRGAAFRAGARLFAPCMLRRGIFFHHFGERWIKGPVISDAAREQEVVRGEHLTLYMPRTADELLIDIARRLPVEVHIFSKSAAVHATGPEQPAPNVWLYPNDARGFLKDLATSCGLLSNAGTAAPQEALFFGKPMFIVPEANQYEQELNLIAMNRVWGFVASWNPMWRRLTPKAFGAAGMRSGMVTAVKRWLRDLPSIPRQSFPDHARETLDEVIKELECGEVPLRF